MISVDELRAAGALDVPPSWRKSLAVERHQLPLFGDDDLLSEKEETTADDDDSDVAADELT